MISLPSRSVRAPASPCAATANVSYVASSAKKAFPSLIAAVLVIGGIAALILAACVCLLCVAGSLALVSLPTFVNDEIAVFVDESTVELKYLVLGSLDGDNMDSTITFTVSNPAPFDLELAPMDVTVYDDSDNELGTTSSSAITLKASATTTVTQSATLDVTSISTLHDVLDKALNSESVTVKVKGSADLLALNNFWRGVLRKSVSVGFQKSISVTGMGTALQTATLVGMILKPGLQSTVDLSVNNPSVMSGTLPPLQFQLMDANLNRIGTATTTSQSLSLGPASVVANARMQVNAASDAIAAAYLNGQSVTLKYKVILPFGAYTPGSSPYYNLIGRAMANIVFTYTLAPTSLFTSDVKTVNLTSICSEVDCKTVTVDAAVSAYNPTTASGILGQITFAAYYKGLYLGTVQSSPTQQVSFTGQGTQTITLKQAIFTAAQTSSPLMTTLINNLLNGLPVSVEATGSGGPSDWTALLADWQTTATLSGFSYSIAYVNFEIVSSATDTVTAILYLSVKNPIGIALTLEKSTVDLYVEGGVSVGQAYLENVDTGGALTIQPGTQELAVKGKIIRTPANTAAIRQFIDQFVAGEEVSATASGNVSTKLVDIFTGSPDLSISQSLSLVQNNGSLIKSVTLENVQIPPPFPPPTQFSCQLQVVVHNPSNAAGQVSQVVMDIYYENAGTSTFMYHYHEIFNPELDVGPYQDYALTVDASISVETVPTILELLLANNLYIDTRNGVATVNVGDFTEMVDFTVTHQKVNP